MEDNKEHKQIVSSLKRKLLDFSRRNNLINYKFAVSRYRPNLRIIDEVPDTIYKKIQKGKPLCFQGIPLPEIKSPSDENTKEFKKLLQEEKINNLDYKKSLEKFKIEPNSKEENRIENELKDSLRKKIGLPPVIRISNINIEEEAKKNKINPSFELLLESSTKGTHVDNCLQTREFEHDLQAQLSRIYNKSKLYESELGINTLFLVFGFIQWYEADHSSESLVSPLIIMPVQIKQIKGTNGLDYTIEHFEEEPSLNMSLKEKLYQDFNIKLPEFADFIKEQPETEGVQPVNKQEQSPIKDYLLTVEKLIQGQNSWKVLKQMSLSILSFQKISLFKDLEEYEEQKPKELVVSLMGNKETLSGTFEPDYDLESPDMVDKVPPIVADADSSQISSIIDILDGKNIVIEGPPGTGKSQTITNMISALVHQGKKVLFVAEKSAALKVVKNRLDKVGVGNFCLELHSNKVRKSQVIEAVQGAISSKSKVYPWQSQLSDINQKETQIRLKIKKYLDYLLSNSPLEENQIIREEIGQYLIFKDMYSDLIKVLETEIHIKELSALDKVERQKLIEELTKLTSLGISLSNKSYENHPLYKTSLIKDLDLYKSKNLVQESIKNIEEILIKISEMPELSFAKDMSLSALKRIFTSYTQIPLDSEVSVSFFEMSLDSVVLMEIKQSVENIEYLQNQLLEFKKIKQNLKLEDVKNDSFLNDVSELIKKLQPLSWSQNIDELPEHLDCLKNGLYVYRDLEKELKELVENVFKYTESLTTDDFKAITNLVQHFGKISSDHLKVNDSSLYDEDKKDKITKSLNKLIEINKLVKEMEENVDLKSVSLTDIEIKEYHQLMTNPGFFFFWTPTYFRIKKSIKKVSLIKKVSREFVYKNIVQLEQLRILKKELIEIGMCLEYNKTILEEYTRKQDLLNIIESIKPFSRKRIFKKLITTLQKLDSNSLEILKGLSYSFQDLKKLDELLSQNKILIEEIDHLDKKVINIQSVLDYVKQKQLSQESTIEDYQLVVSESHRFNNIYNSLYNRTTSKLFSFNKQVDEVNLSNLKKLVNYREIIDSLNLDVDSKSILFKNDFLSLRLTHLKAVAKHSLQLISSLENVNKDNSHLPVNVFQSLSVNHKGLSLYLKYESDLSSLQEINNHQIINNEFCLNRKRFLTEILNFNIPLEKVAHIVQLLHIHSALKIASLDKDIDLISGNYLDEIRLEYQKLDDKKLEVNANMIQSTLADKALPSSSKKGNLKVSEKEGVDLINHLISKPNARISLREFLFKSGEDLSEIMPCFMMSPLSVAQFLPQNKLNFDVLIIDEASQVKVEDILSSVIRCNQIVVVGDNKQLPPTSFFQTEDIENEDLDTDYESILDMTEKAFAHKRRLKWHYRSKDESLIKFSNASFYDGDLILFPSTLIERGIGLIPRRIDGIYENNKNVAEAEAIVDETIECIKQFPNRSLGLAAVNKAQAELIEDLFYEKIKEDAFVQEYLEKWEDKLEPFFIKNLENVQGDERDSIYISLVYGRDNAGQFYNRFGPINSDKGHRRLNVLFSRAKSVMKVFYSIPADGILVQETSKEGVRCLKNFITFLDSEGSYLPVSKKLMGAGLEAQMSVFEDYVVGKLEKRGFLVKRQVGESGYFIDLAIKDPECGGYIVGIECDGKTYHSSKYMRDRDKTRQKILEGLGWKIIRIWSTDWFKDSNKELDRVVEKINSLKSN